MYLLPLLLLLSPTQTAKVNLMSVLKQGSIPSPTELAELQLAFAPSCDFNIKRIKNGPENWRKFIGTGSKYSDPLMPADTSLVVWKGYERTDSAALTSYLSYIRSYKRPSEIETAPSIWGLTVDRDDIDQGSVGDCYMVSVAASLAEYPERVKKLFMQQEYVKEGIFGLRLHVRGKPTYLTIDDRLPYTSSAPLFASKGSGGSWWMPILEKAYTKVFVNYETIGFGWMSESARVLTGAPSYRYTSNSKSVSEIWDILKTADQKRYVLTAASMTGVYGLAKGHAYSLVGVYELKNSAGSVV
jgi:Calpain family cysteine protease